MERDAVAGRERIDWQRMTLWATVALGAAIPISVQAVAVLSLVLVVLGLLSGEYVRHWRAVLRHPVALAALALFVWLLVALLYGSATWEEGLHALKKYRELLLIPLWMPFFHDPQRRRLGLYAFLGAMLLTLAVSWVEGIGLLIHSNGEVLEAVVFKQRITQNTLMALAVFWMALQALRPGRRGLWIGLIVLALADMFLLVGGRTGELVLVALAGLLLFHQYRWKGLATAALGTITLVTLLYLSSGPFKARIDEAREGLVGYRSGEYNLSTSMRLSFYKNSLALIGQRPLLGFGTGSFTSVYAAQVAGSAYPATENPHNEYLLIGIQSGLIGVALYLYLLGRQWWEARRLSGEERLMAQALVLTMVLGCLLNSFLLDHTEGHLYAYLTALLFAPLLRSEDHTRSGSRCPPVASPEAISSRNSATDSQRLFLLEA